MSRKVAPGQCWPDLGWPPAPLGTQGPFKGARVGVAEPGGQDSSLYSAEVSAKVPLRGQERQRLPAKRTFSCLPGSHMRLGRDKGHT